MGEAFALLPSHGHFQAAITTIAQKYDMPGIFYLDLWPASWSQLIVTDPDVALHMTVTRNHPKHEIEAYYADPLIGPGNMLTSEGPRWKHLHKMLSPAFSITHVSNLRPMVAAEVMLFRSKLQEKSRSGEVFKLERLTEYLTFDVIGTATLSVFIEVDSKWLDANTSRPIIAAILSMHRLKGVTPCSILRRCVELS